MRLTIALRTLILLPALVSSTVLLAQFQQPTPEELSMTADPAYPDAAAVYLYREAKTDDTHHYTSEHVRIKILKESAKELATVNLGYFRGNMKIEAISGRTIHADGTVIPLEVKPEDLMRVKAGQAEIHEVVFTLPSVEVGSILEYYYQGRYGENRWSEPYWEIQARYPVRKARYLFVPFPGLLDNNPGTDFGPAMFDAHGNRENDLMWYVHLPGGKSLAPDASKRFVLELTDIPPLPREQWMPPLESQRYEVRFYFSAVTSVSAYWNSEGSYWLKDVDRFAAANEAIRNAAAGLVAPGDSEIDTARKLYAAVQALDNTNFSRRKSDAELRQQGYRPAKHAEDTWTHKSGSGEDIALLYLALLRGAGLKAYPMKVVDRNRGFFNENYLNFNQLNDLVIILASGGKEIVLDPAEKMCPFETVHWTHSGAGGIRQSDIGIEPWVTPLLPYSANAVTRRADLTLSPGGAVTGKLQFGITGQDALAWRQRALERDEGAVKHEFEEWMARQLPPGVEAHLLRFANLDDPKQELTAYATVSGAPGSATAKRLLLPASFFVSSSDRTFIEQPNRQMPVDMHYAAQTKDGVLYHLPPGYAVESLPQPASIPWAGHAVLQTKAAATGSDVTLTHTLARTFTVLDATEYKDLRDFYQKAAAADQQQLVLSISSQPKGN